MQSKDRLRKKWATNKFKKAPVEIQSKAIELYEVAKNDLKSDETIDLFSPIDFLANGKTFIPGTYGYLDKINSRPELLNLFVDCSFHKYVTYMIDHFGEQHYISPLILNA